MQGDYFRVLAVKMAEDAQKAAEEAGSRLSESSPLHGRPANYP